MIKSWVLTLIMLGILCLVGCPKAEQKRPELTRQVLDVVRGELARFVDTVTEEELRRAKNQIKASLLMSRESTTAIAEWIARHLHNYGEYRTAQQLVARIDAITLADIRRVFHQVMATPTPVTAILGSVGEEGVEVHNLLSYKTR